MSSRTYGLSVSSEGVPLIDEMRVSPLFAIHGPQIAVSPVFAIHSKTAGAGTNSVP